jgi:predicted GTPase
MKKQIVLLLIVCVSAAPFLWAWDGCNQHISPDEFRKKQKAFITEKAELTRQEITEFFPVYFELQDKKKELYDRIAQLMHQQGRKENVTEAQYQEIIEKASELRVSQEELDRIYYEKFKKILSYKKIYLVQRAEMHFNRELLKVMNRENFEQRERRF